MNPKTVLVFLLVLLFGTLYYFITEPTNLQKVEVQRIIDGDTLELASGQKVRLLGINSPESQMPGSQKATNTLKEMLDEKEVYIEKIGVDKYGRILAYLFASKENINLKQLKTGNAHLYYYDKDKYYSIMLQAEETAREKQIGIWSKSNYSNCVKLIELDYYDKGEDNETLKIENNCNTKIDVIIKDDATHIYQENLNTGIYTKTFRNIFNDDGDTLYIWDSSGYLILFYRYP